MKNTNIFTIPSSSCLIFFLDLSLNTSSHKFLYVEEDNIKVKPARHEYTLLTSRLIYFCAIIFVHTSPSLEQAAISSFLASCLIMYDLAWTVISPTKIYIYRDLTFREKRNTYWSEKFILILISKQQIVLTFILPRYIENSFA